MASELPQRRRGGFWNVGKYLLPIVVVGAGLVVWQLWGQEKVSPKRQRTLLTSPGPPAKPAPAPAAPAEPAPPPEALTEAEEILLKCASTYAQANSWRAVYSLDFVSRAASDEFPQAVSVEVAVRRPNRYYQVTQGSGLMGISLNSSTISDGANIYTYFESLGQVLTTPAPQTLAELAQALTPEMPQRVSEASLMAGVNPLDSVEAVTLAGSEEVNGRTCYILDLTFAGEAMAAGVQGLIQRREGSNEPSENIPFRATNGSQRLWIDTEDLLIRKQRLDMTMDLRSAGQEAFGGQVPTSALPEASEKTVTQTYSKVHLDEDLPDSWFAFTLPEGAKVVERLDLSTLLEEMLGQ